MLARFLAQTKRCWNPWDRKIAKSGDKSDENILFSFLETSHLLKQIVKQVWWQSRFPKYLNRFISRSSLHPLTVFLSPCVFVTQKIKWDFRCLFVSFVRDCHQCSLCSKETIWLWWITNHQREHQNTGRKTSVWYWLSTWPLFCWAIFLATLVALHFTPVSKSVSESVSRSFGLA